MNLAELYDRVLNAPYTHLDPETASYYMEREGSSLLLLFEESNGKTDWWNNFDFPARPYRDMEDKWYAHRGFLRVWKVIEPHLAEAIADPTVKSIEIAGYSHGAAIALLCYEYCQFHRPDAWITGYGFGAPRVVWGPIPKKVKERISGFIVIRNGRDLVTHLPPVFLGFRHAGITIPVGESKGLIKDHYPERYQEALKDFEADEQNVAS